MRIPIIETTAPSTACECDSIELSLLHLMKYANDLPMLLLSCALILGTSHSSAPSVLKANTKIDVVLNSMLSSFPEQMEFKGTPKAGSKEGDPVSMLVASDVVDQNGTVIIRKGTPVDGKVRFARLGKVLVSWPRIYVSVDTTRTVDGTVVPLKGSLKDVWNGPAFEFTQQNTFNYIPKPLIELAMKKRKPTESELSALMGLASVTADGLVFASELNKIGNVMQTLFKPFGLSDEFHNSFSKPAQTVAVVGLSWVLGAAISEATKKRSALDQEYLNNILAWPGTPMTGFVAQDTSIQSSR